MPGQVTNPAFPSRLLIPTLLLITLTLGGCVSRELRTVDMTPPQQAQVPPSEELLLDVGVAIFDPNIPESYDERIERLIQSDVREAEAYYMPYFAKNLLESTGNWGAVRVIPRPTHAVDVVVTGRILHSDGESLEVEIEVVDATGQRWLKKPYRALASRYAYDASIPRGIDPFQTIYKTLADDMLAYQQQLDENDLERIRTTAQMKFAREFAPDAFSGHVAEVANGGFELRRLPAADDPMLARVRRIREREYLFIDTLDEYYENYHRSMYPAYQGWRQATYDEAIAYKQLRAQARARAIGGAAAVVGGVAAMVESDSSVQTIGGIVGIAAGAVTLKSALDKRAEASIHAEMLQEVGIAAEAELLPYTIEMENQVVRLQGTVDEQYESLRGILRQLYYSDLDLPVPPADVPLPVLPADVPLPVPPQAATDPANDTQ